MVHTLSSWFSHPVANVCLVLFAVVAVVASIVLVPRFLAKLPDDYLRSEAPPSPSMPRRVLRNLLGIVLVLLGVAMLLLPGQGLLTLLVGLLLVDFPGKHRLVVRALSRPKVLALVNKLRARHGSRPLVA
jgi:Na+/H+ antiporter NhaD/arsenite permease-like protein